MKIIHDQDSLDHMAVLNWYALMTLHVQVKNLCNTWSYEFNVSYEFYLKTKQEDQIGSLNAHLISGPSISTKTNLTHCLIGQGQLRAIIYTNFVRPWVSDAAYQISRS